MNSLIKNLFVIALFTVFSFSCSDDEKKTLSEPVFKIKDNSLSYSLENGNLLLLQEGVEADFNYRNYAITDGEFIEGEVGDELNDYTNATYLVIISLGVRESFSPENYIQSNQWGDADFYSYLYMGSADDLSFFTETQDGNPVKISGGFNDGEKMKLQFTGELNYSRLDQSTGNVINSDEEVVFYFEGIITDRRQFD